MTAKTDTYARDQLFHAISRDKDPRPVQFKYLPHHKVEATQVINGPTFIISEELFINPNEFIIRSGIE